LFIGLLLPEANIAKAVFCSELSFIDCSSVCKRTEAFSKDKESSQVLIAELKEENSLGKPLRMI
jgi:hypothetical protein